MRKIQMIAVFLFVFSTVSGQTEWVVSTHSYDYGKGLIRTSQGHTIMLHGYHGISVFDKHGNYLLTHNLDGPSELYYSTISKIIEMPDSSIIFKIGYHGCYDSYSIKKFKFDKDWNKIPPTDYYYELNHDGDLAGLFSDGSHLFNTNLGLAKTDANDNPLWVINDTDYNSLLVTEEDTIYAFTQNSVYKISSDGEVVADYQNLSLQWADILPDGTLLAGFDKKLYRFDSDFNQLAFVEIAAQHIADISFDESKIAVLTGNNSIISLNYSLETIGNIMPSRNDENFYALEVIEDSVLICGAEPFGIYPYSSQSAFIKKYALDGTSTNSGRDAAVTHVGFNKISLDAYSGNDVFITDVKLTIKNVGLEPINEVTVNANLHEIYYVPCLTGSFQFSRLISNINLLPGESQIITFDTIYTWFAPGYFNDSTNIGFWLSEPDNLLDSDNENNTIFTSLFTPMPGPVLPPVSFYYYFNSNTNELHIETPEDLNINKTEAFVYDASGRLVLKFPVTEQRQTQALDLSYGAYFVKVVSKKWKETGKFVKY